MDLKNISTNDLFEELKTREAVQHVWVDPYEKFELFIKDEKQKLEINEGAANILIIWD